MFTKWKTSVVEAVRQKYFVFSSYHVRLADNDRKTETLIRIYLSVIGVALHQYS
jgi:hypothetical protein